MFTRHPGAFPGGCGYHSLRLVYLAVLLPSLSCAYAPPRDHLQAGEGINIFQGYGYLRQGFHVLPLNSSSQWIIKEPTFEVLKDVSMQNDSLRHGGDIEFEFCYGPKHLVIAYFRHFAIQGMPKVWKSFLLGWDRDAFSKWMGIAKHYLSNSYSYILIRVIRKRKRGWLEGSQPTFADSAEEDIDRVCAGDEGSALRFFAKRGTHYVSSYTTGGLMYQVYVFSHRKYAKVIAELQKKKVNEWSQEYFDFVFSPFFANHVGRVMLGSGDAGIGPENNLNTSFFIYSHPSILKAYRNESLMRQLADFLGDDIIVQMELKTLIPAIRDHQKRIWMDEILSNRLALWDVSM